MSDIVERTLSGGSIRALPEHPAVLDERAGVSELPIPGALASHGSLEEGARPSGKSLLVFRRLREARPIPGPRRQQLMLAGLFMSNFLMGWNDGSQGPLIPSLQEYYHLTYLVVSIIWAFNFLGFFSYAATNVFWTDRFGFGIVAPCGSFIQGLGYTMMCWGGPYPLFVFGFVLIGFGMGTQDAQVNAMCSRLENASTKMFVLHAFYGLGATISPLVSTEFVKRVPGRVYLYYTVSLGLAMCCAVALILIFDFRTDDQVVGKREVAGGALPRLDTEEKREPASPTSTGAATPAQLDIAEKHARSGAGADPHAPDGLGEPEPDQEDSGRKMRRILAQPVVHYLAFYIMIYVGLEVSVGGWLTSFLESERGASSSAGYVTTGFFGGLTLGRVVLIPTTQWMGKHNSIYVYSAIALALELVVWFARSVVADAVCFSLIGLVLGPMYPAVMVVVVDVMEPDLSGGAIGWIASLGQGGSAIMPFVIGAISDRYGVWVLQPICIAFTAFMAVIWFFVRRTRDPHEDRVKGFVRGWKERT